MSYSDVLATCGATYSADRVMNRCERDGRPVQMMLDLERLKAERGSDAGWDPSRRDRYVPEGYFNVATFQEPGWRTEGRKTLGLEMAEPRGDQGDDRRW